MKTAIVLKFAASALVIGLVAVGCTPGGSHVASVSSDAPRGDRQAGRQAARAINALRERQAAEAIGYAESAVAISPRDAGYRAILGQAYMLAGRFQSAETAFADAVALGDTAGRTELNLTLAQIALGKNDVARDRIATLSGRVGEVDRGLALALAGDKEGALPILQAAARTSGADATARQNLALVYALNGRWAEAQSTAAQDLPPQQLLQRMRDWALLAQPRAASDQVAHLMNITPAADPGLPVALALAPVATPSSTTFRHTSGVVHRLTLAGFATPGEAWRVCNQVKAQGDQCFVRAAAGEQPISWASRRSDVQVASR